MWLVAYASPLHLIPLRDPLVVWWWSMPDWKAVARGWYDGDPWHRWGPCFLLIVHQHGLKISLLSLTCHCQVISIIITYKVYIVTYLFFFPLLFPDNSPSPFQVIQFVTRRVVKLYFIFITSSWFLVSYLTCFVVHTPMSSSECSGPC